MKILFPIISNVIAVVFFYLLEKKTNFKRNSDRFNRLLIGIVFGGIAVMGSELGMEIPGATVNVRDSAPLLAGLVFGWQAGIIAGTIGGGYRALSVFWGAGVDTALACSIATFLAGIIAALLRKYMFDDKKPTWAYAFGIAIVMEVLHMLMIFITNLNNANLAFTFVKECTIPMSTLNALTVGGSVFLVTILSGEKIIRKKSNEQIAQTFQRRLVICILIAFVITSFFTFTLQTNMRERQIQETFESTMQDVIADIKGKSDSTLENTAISVKEQYQNNFAEYGNSLDTLASKQGIFEINIIDSAGIIVQSTTAVNLNFDMASSEQSNEFVDNLLNKAENTTFVQKYGPIGHDGVTLRKYAGITLSDGGFLQVGYDEEQFHYNLDKFVIDFTKNRRVGANGFVAVCDEKLNMVTEDSYNGVHISSIGITPNEEMTAKTYATTIYTTDIINSETNYKVEHLYVFTFEEGYCIITAIPKDDAMLLRDASAYLTIFMQIVTFGALFVLVYFLIKKLIIDNIHKINGTLSKISSGNLDETVDVRSNIEFASLSDDINATVDTLKKYIKEAAARIDKELEYAKQIQLSALPNNYPSTEQFEIYAQMIAAKEVGGDFYDFYSLSNDLVAFLVADVSGKGIPAAMFMMTAKTIIKDLAERGLKVNEIFTKANEKLCENNESGMFVTAWMGILDLSTGKLTYANAGHNPPLLLKNEKFTYLKSRPGFVLAGMEGVKYRINELQLDKDDRIFLYTDGVTEATNVNNDLYGEDRLLSFMNDNLTLKATQILPKLKKDIDEFVGEAPQFDDITMLIFDYKYKGEE